MFRLILCNTEIMFKVTTTTHLLSGGLFPYVLMLISLLPCLVVVLQQDAEHSLHALGLHRLSCELKQVLQGIGGVGRLAEVNVQRCRLTGFGQTQLLGWSLFMCDLSGYNNFS